MALRTTEATLAASLVSWAAMSSPCRLAIIAPNNHALAVMMDELAECGTGVKKRGPRSLVWANGSEAAGFLSEAPDRVRGPEFSIAWAHGVEADAEIIAALRTALRVGPQPTLLMTWGSR